MDEDNPGTKIGTADNLVFNVLDTNHEAFQNLETTPIETATITEEGLPIQVETKEQINKSIFADIDVSDDRSAANALNTRFGLTKRESNVMFSPYGTGPGRMQRLRGCASQCPQMAKSHAWVHPQRKNQTSSFGDCPESGTVRELAQEQAVQGSP